jgi:hypothetical protein
MLQNYHRFVAEFTNNRLAITIYSSYGNTDGGAKDRKSDEGSY